MYKISNMTAYHLLNYPGKSNVSYWSPFYDPEKDKELCIVRYMSLWKFIDLVLNKKLVFTSIHDLLEFHEGDGLTSQQRLQRRALNQALGQLAGEITSAPDPMTKSDEIRSLQVKLLSHRFYTSCWSVSEYNPYAREESLALWTSFANTPDSVAIALKLTALIQKLPENREFIIGRVNYGGGIADFPIDPKFKTDCSQSLTFFSKPKAYMYENEFRLLAFEAEDKTCNHIEIKIDLPIEDVILSPKSNPTIKNLVEQILKSSDYLDTRVIGSILS